MSIFEKVSLGISIIALIISLAVYFKNKLYSSASLEATIFAQISFAKSNLSSATENRIVFNKDISDLALHEKSAAISAKEDLVKAYEFACQHYRSGAVNRENFNNLYKAEIESLFTDPAFSEIINGKYPALKMFQDSNQNHV